MLSCATWSKFRGFSRDLGATPKGVLRVMGVQGLTIYHVKSHLQKYRLAKYLPESTSDGSKSDKAESAELCTDLDGTSGMQITEALNLQMEVQKRLHEQLEVQRQLQLRIEAQCKYLKIIEEQDGSGSGIPAPILGEHCPESDKKTPASTPTPTSHSPLQDKMAKEPGAKSLSCDKLFSSHHEHLKPDSGHRTTSPAKSPGGERTVKRQLSIGHVYARPAMMLTHPIIK
ncbi:myb family transcription factor PHL7-like isoform X2 [Tasmannia lanceolata]|uniref:myb family transcription factor PHL7-like isoform X2 n=1 Tax=Tasmannia lanceolata TaxID=3420 RepID=UPI0040629732